MINEKNVSGPIPSSFGNFTNIWQLLVSGNNLTGTIPQEIVNLNNLQILNVDNNQLTDLPDLNSIGDAFISVGNNRLTFEDIEPNMSIQNFYYWPQDSVGIAQDTTINLGSSLTFSVSVGGTANKYCWKKNGVKITGAISDTLMIKELLINNNFEFIKRTRKANQLWKKNG